MNTLSVTFSFDNLKNEFDQFNKEVGRAAFAVQSFMAYSTSATYAESTRTTITNRSLSVALADTG
ncbi:hypothetical protein BMW22_06815 [Rhizobium leguminosarum]|uniref:Uncharacterized protein n=1 Tax=Rhizobium leguminosarum TaxID=384 RepID=A0A1L3Z6X7_RHILE|nr:hypothetical protein BMW22_06815 [Rhizobium leguminosarum]